jgi:hypothetical protein
MSADSHAPTPEVRAIAAYRKPEPRVIAALEKLLSEVKSGEVCSAVVVFVTNSGESGRTIALNDRLMLILAELRLAEHRVVDQIRSFNGGDV